jgi:hypothetical protein
LFAKEASYLAAGFVRALLNGGEVEGCSGILGPEEFLRDLGEKLLETGVLGRIGRCDAKHDGPP